MGWFRSSTSSRGGDQHASTFEERLAAIEPGVPGHCPSCDGLGYIDELDLAGRYQIQHCKSCGHRWEYLFDGDAHVVGVTELDDEGRPVARMRVRSQVVLAEMDRARRAAPVLPPLTASPDEDAVIDLRDGAGGSENDGTDAAGGAVIDLTEPVSEEASEEASDGPGHMSPAEWLRHSLRR